MPISPDNAQKVDSVNLGLRIIDYEKKQDSTRINVISAIAGDFLKVGEHVGFNTTGEAVKATRFNGIKSVGIVDPFLIFPVGKGQCFWILIYPA